MLCLKISSCSIQAAFSDAEKYANGTLKVNQINTENEMQAV